MHVLEINYILSGWSLFDTISLMRPQQAEATLANYLSAAYKTNINLMLLRETARYTLLSETCYIGSLVDSLTFLYVVV